MNLKPIGDGIVIRVIKPSGKLPSGLVDPYGDATRWQRAMVLAVGPGRRARRGDGREPSCVEPGAVVLTRWRAGVAVDGECVRLVRPDDLVAEIPQTCSTCALWQPIGNLGLGACTLVMTALGACTLADDDACLWSERLGVVS